MKPKKYPKITKRQAEDLYIIAKHVRLHMSLSTTKAFGIWTGSPLSTTLLAQAIDEVMTAINGGKKRGTNEKKK